MLFDLRGRGRRRTIQVIYLTLAILMGGGLILFGIGGATSGGLVDAITGGGGGGTTSFEDRVEEAREKVAANPQDADALASLILARWALAQQEASEQDAETAEEAWAAPEVREQLNLADRAWQRYVALDPAEINAGAAGAMLQVYSLLEAPEKAVRAAEALTEAQPNSYGPYTQLFQVALQAGQDRKAQLAYDRALELAAQDSKQTRDTVKSQMDAVRQAIENPGAAASGDDSSATGE
ncbi:MAG: hypothetical protein IRZ32_06300 [Solirubrobacteraceae bacterium]|nr:hypothetical protein [Solirubrobacteraceae bacterium]